jgi:very-short-patch-repair endonuclease/transcription elongation GreA/GreB family factor
VVTEIRKKLISLLDYVEQVVRLDERVVFRISEYRLPDGTSFTLAQGDSQNLPGVRHNTGDDEGPVWLEVERLTRGEPPRRPDLIAEWVSVSSDPAKLPEAKTDRIITVSANDRDAAIASGKVQPSDVLEALPKRGDSENAPKRFDLKLHLHNYPDVVAAVQDWIAGPWSEWSAAELPRRQTISLYQNLYKVFQLLENAGAESPIEVVWGIGIVYWQKDNRIVDRPLLERRVDVELDDKRGGLLRVRPASGDVQFDLKPYEELGCASLSTLADHIRREIKRAGEHDGVSPFIRESFEPILSTAGTRLDDGACYAPSVETADDLQKDLTRLTVSDRWVLFARPRSQHFMLQDIDRLKSFAESQVKEPEGLAARLVTQPTSEVASDGWMPLNSRIGGSGGIPNDPDDVDDSLDVFFPKPFNDDQIEIIRRLSKKDGLVVQGPPGTGKTHTIANLVCHAMATGQRVLVVSRGEAALAVLKEQLPKEVQSLAISVLSSEREGLRQVENAIREIQGAVDGTQSKNRRATIHRLEAELDGLRNRIVAIDTELDAIAIAHLTKVGPRGETPAALAQRIVGERDTFQWFSDRPQLFAAETPLVEKDVAALFTARRKCGDLIDHLYVTLPAAEDLPEASEVSRWHEDLIASAEQGQLATRGPLRSLKIDPTDLLGALAAADILDSLVRAHQLTADAKWLEPFRQTVLAGERSVWCDRLQEFIAEWKAAETERALLMRRPVSIPDGLLDSRDALEAVSRAAGGQRTWPRLTIGKADAKAMVAAIRMNGGPIADQAESWRHVQAVVTSAVRQREYLSQWDVFASEVEAPPSDHIRGAINQAQSLFQMCRDALIEDSRLRRLTSDKLGVGRASNDPVLCTAAANQIRAMVASLQFASVGEQRRRLIAIFEQDDRTSALGRQLLQDVLGRPAVSSEQVAQVWNGVRKRLTQLKSLTSDFAIIREMSEAIASSGAPSWAAMLSTEKHVADDPRTSSIWRDAWDHAASEAALERIDARDRLTKLAAERDAADKRCKQLFGDIVRERTFYELEARLSPAIRTALVEFVRALARIGRGTGRAVGTHRRTAREAMARCYNAAPCWIMPTWRVAEQLPAELGAVDLVIIDEASQSDVTELPALLRGKKLLVVGDDRQVSPTAPFVTQEKIAQLRHHYLGDLPFKSLLEPGESIYDLMRAVFPNERLMLKEHFRCVEPIIRFSMQFYPETMVPLRIPEGHERLDPPLIDIYVPHGRRETKKKINTVEADVIVDEIAKITSNPAMNGRTIGVISLVGAEQAEYIRAKLSQTIGEELMQRHSVLCGDSAKFQGSERDIVFLSMVADSSHKTALTMLRYEQRFNVAVSRARDRAVLVRSVRREELNPDDLKARLIAHFENPMPQSEREKVGLEACDSDFERDMMRRLLDLGYRVQPQVGSVGYRIDMVVEGANRRRLAIECDGDRYHGPEQWRQDMRRQRVLERVGWRFWRCFASSFYRNPTGVTADLVDALTQIGIEPLGPNASSSDRSQFTEHRIIRADEKENASAAVSDVEKQSHASAGLGDKIVLFYADTGKRLSARLFEDGEDLDKGRLSIKSALGAAVSTSEEGDEVEYADGQISRKVLIETIERSLKLEINALQDVPESPDEPLPAAVAG